MGEVRDEARAGESATPARACVRAKRAPSAPLARLPDGMAERDGAAVNVDLVKVEAEFPSTSMSA